MNISTFEIQHVLKALQMAASFNLDGHTRVQIEYAEKLLKNLQESAFTKAESQHYELISDECAKYGCD